jgi:glycosyltransferase involved in cell wall biosynthesis
MKNKKSEIDKNMNADYTVFGQYILITAAKNEEKSLPCLIESIANQSIRPKVWTIVDDGSTDSTSEIIREAVEKHDWIKSIQLGESIRSSKSYAYACKTGFDFGIAYSKKSSIQYEYIGLMDADMIPSTKFFEELIEEFERNPKLGIASGGVYYNGGTLTHEKGREDLPRGGMRLWRRKCFEETGGYLLTSSPDSVANIKAKIKGWEIKQFKDIKAIQTRKTSTAEGFWKGYKAKGVSSYFVNLNPILALLRGIGYLFEKPYYIGLAYLWGYFGSFLRKQERIDDKEICEYYYKNKFQEVRQYYFNQLKNNFKRK